MSEFKCPPLPPPDLHGYYGTHYKPETVKHIRLEAIEHYKQWAAQQTEARIAELERLLVQVRAIIEADYSTSMSGWLARTDAALQEKK